jgi:hypothetical protein
MLTYLDQRDENCAKIDESSGLRLRLICCHRHGWPPESFLDGVTGGAQPAEFEGLVLWWSSLTMMVSRSQEWPAP